MREIIRKNYILFSLLFLFLGTGFIVLILFPKGDFELWVNRKHHFFLDEFFFYITYLGDGRVLVPIILLSGLRKRYTGFMVLLSFLLSTLVVQAMKRTFFADYPRPSKFFEKMIDIHVIDGLELHSYYSFPSGHSSGAFAVFVMWALLVKNKSCSIFFFLLAFLTAFSRIYLMQHFLIDIYFGAIAGAGIAVLVYYYLDLKSTLPQKQFLQRPLFGIFDKK